MVPRAHGPETCRVSVVFPILQGEIQMYTGNLSKMGEAIKEGFVVNWKKDTDSCSACTQSKGVCGYDVNTNQSTCYCSDQTHGPKPYPSPTIKSPIPKMAGSRPVGTYPW